MESPTFGPVRSVVVSTYSIPVYQICVGGNAEEYRDHCDRMNTFGFILHLGVLSPYCPKDAPHSEKPHWSHRMQAYVYMYIRAETSKAARD